MEDGARGTVTSLSSIFPVEEAHKAAKRVEDAIAEKQEELERIRGFISDNSNIIHLVQKLPEELHHDIMVPFGKAAFFPGRLIHTNEFLVLLGEGYYAERTSKQTVDILTRRAKALESHVDSLKANIDDLRAEASFFGSTASEVAEGLVEIREELPEEASDEGQSESGSHDQGFLNSSKGDKGPVSNEEFTRIMSRLDELEEEELAAERGDGSDEEEGVGDKAMVSNEEYAQIMSRMDELEEEELAAERGDVNDEGDEVGDFSCSIPDKDSFNQSHITSKLNLLSQSGDGHPSRTLSKKQPQPDISEQFNFESSRVQAAAKDNLSHGQSSKHEPKNFPAAEKAPALSSVEENIQTSSKHLPVSMGKSIMHAPIEKIQTQQSSNEEAPVEQPKPTHDSLKAFTGTIVERPPTVQMNRGPQAGTSSQVSGSQPSKPVSRFKLQRK